MVAVIVLVLAATSYLISKNIITEYSRNLLSSSIANQANEIESWLNENLSAFQTAKRSIEKTNPDEAALQKILDSYYQFNDNYPEGLYVADENGKLMKAEGSARSIRPIAMVPQRQRITCSIRSGTGKGSPG